MVGGVLKTGGVVGLSWGATVMHERHIMAAEIHDSIAQTLTFVKMRLPLLQDALLVHDDPQAMKYLGDVRQAVGESHASLREIVTHFRTRIDSRGLARALESLVARFRERNAIELSYVKRGAALSLSTEVETEVFHIAQTKTQQAQHHEVAAGTGRDQPAQVDELA